MQRLRPEHDVDIRRALHDRRALLAGNAATDANDEVRVRRLQGAHAAEVVKNPLLRLFSHRAGVEQYDVGLFGAIGQVESLGFVQQVGHLVRVVLVHLATEGADVELLRHTGCLAAGGYPDEAWVGKGPKIIPVPGAAGRVCRRGNGTVYNLRAAAAGCALPRRLRVRPGWARWRVHGAGVRCRSP